MLLGWVAHLAVGASVIAQTPTTDLQSTNKPTEIPRVVVTGSMIPTVEAVGPSPVKTITADDIQKQGAATVTEVLRKLPQNTASLDDKFQNGFAPGSAAISLRGLGSKATLVLLNGHRLAPYGFGENISDAFVDLNTLPTAAVERIEVLKDGASAIYGSDAIAGVVNIILKKDYSGTEITARFGNTTDKDAFEQSYSVVTGMKDEKTSALFSADYYHREAIFLRDRSYSRSANHESQGGYDFSSSLGPYPAWIFTPNFDPLNGGSYGTFPSGVAQVNADGTFSDDITGNYFDYNPYISMVPETTRWGFMGTVTRKLEDWVDLEMEASFRNAWTHSQQAPTPMSGDQPPNLFGYPGNTLFIVPASNPYNPFGVDVTFRRRLLEAGPRINDINTDAVRFSPGLKFHMTHDWEAETTFLYNKVVTEDHGRNYLNADAVQAALNSTDPATALNIFAPAVPGGNSVALIESLKTETWRRGETELLYGDVKANGPLFKMPGGDLMVALGVDGRRERYNDQSDPISASEHVVSLGASSGAGSREAGAAFVELAIPLVGRDNESKLIHSLDLQLAGRMDHYSDFGTHWTPKIGLKYRPTEEIVLRGSYGQGFRAPSLQELYLGQSTSFLEFIDDQDPASPYYNQPHEYRVINSGNPTLEPETSDNWSAGIVYEPKKVPGLTLSIDWGYIHQKSAIADYDPYYVLQNFPNNVVRDPNTHEISTLTNTWANLGARKVQFIDFGGTYVRPTDLGQFTFTGDFTWLYSWKDQTAQGEPFTEYRGTYQYPEWRGVGSLFWEKGSWGAGVTVNWISSYDQLYQATAPSVDDMVTVDLQLSREFPHGFKATVGVLNVADAAPPFSDGESEGYDFVTHDPRGRFVYLEVTKKF
ncbi:MAG: hypothetical protein RLY20_2018 [Verrucomicrobiota bacterium]